MQKVDFIIVGCGLAGLAFCEQLRKANKSFHVIDNQNNNASRVASGLYNPVVLKRLNFIWKGKEQMALVETFYKELEEFLDITIDEKFNILRILHSNEEKNDWLVAADDSNLKNYLTIPFIQNDNRCIKAPFGFGKVVNTGKIDTETLLDAYFNYLKNNNLISLEKFNYSDLEFQQDGYTYRDLSAKNILFAEGHGVIHNPFFNPDIVNGTKGELLVINAPRLKLHSIIKSSVFIIPLGNDDYLVGSTYNWDDKTWQPTTKAKEEIVSKLDEFLVCEYKIIDHYAGIRPTTKDRRPIIGEHPDKQNMYIINGLGTRGVLIAPYVAQTLFGSIFNGINLDYELSYNRLIKT
ncbi:NAD(P)/FAD-dependent oxidoreductase [Aegicerativicinus sediminis]